MSKDQNHTDVISPLTRRTFLTTTAGSIAAASVGVIPAAHLLAKPASKKIKSETLVASLYKTLTEEQKKLIVFPFDHPLREKVDNNWHITKEPIKRLFTADQQEMVREIFLGLHSERYAKKVLGQVAHDSNEKGLGGCSVAFFGQPGEEKSKFEFVLTGRHVTRRCDGNSVEGAAFGGPIFYGHAATGFDEEAHHPGNIYWYQSLRANEAFQMLDGKQRKQALIETSPPRERKTATVKLTGDSSLVPGISMTDLSGDQKQLVRKVIGDVLAPYREQDVKETLKLIEKAGFDNLKMAFYKMHDLGGDGVWDIWRIEGPTAIMYFRGAPHVHAWLHVREKVQPDKEKKNS
ncbi:MAG: DUF3500 domain-containing protein [Planctomycetes bacterium]|nr:DUF3500 domain-containing protein [Planctomycetota bacterium]